MIVRPSGLWLPNSALGASIGGEQIPGGIKWPQTPDYVKGLVDGAHSVSDLTGLSYDQGGLVSPPIMSQIAGLKATIEATTGISLNQLKALAGDIQTLTKATDPEKITAAVADLINDVLDVITTVSKAAGVATGVLKVVPVIGQIVGAIAGFMEFYFNVQAADQRYKQYQAECDQLVFKEQQPICQNLTSQATPVATEEGGVTPADMFRPVFYAMQKRQPLPLTTASMFVALCGGETQGAFNLFTRASWAKFVAENNGGKSYIGVTQSTQRRMWELIKGIMAATRDPGYGALFSPGDGGRALFPALVDMTWNMALSGQKIKPIRNGATIDDQFLAKVSKQIGRQYEHARYCAELTEGDAGAGATPYSAVSCADFVDLLAPLQRVFLGYKNHLQASGMLRSDWTWRSNVQDMAAVKNPAQGVLVLGDKTVQELSDTAKAVELANNAAANRKAAMWTTGVVLAGGTFFLGRRYAKKHRAQ